MLIVTTMLSTRACAKHALLRKDRGSYLLSSLFNRCCSSTTQPRRHACSLSVPTNHNNHLSIICSLSSNHHRLQIKNHSSLLLSNQRHHYLFNHCSSHLFSTVASPTPKTDSSPVSKLSSFPFPPQDTDIEEILEEKTDVDDDDNDIDDIAHLLPPVDHLQPPAPPPFQYKNPPEYSPPLSPPPLPLESMYDGSKFYEDVLSKYSKWNDGNTLTLNTCTST